MTQVRPDVWAVSMCRTDFTRMNELRVAGLALYSGFQKLAVLCHPLRTKTPIREA